MNKTIKVTVHDGALHPDELLCLALVKLEYPDHKLDYRRSRNSEDWEWADIVCDTGMRYDGKKWFDHHQDDVPVYKNGVKKSACGLYLEAMTKLTEQEKNYLLEHSLYVVQADDNGQNPKDTELKHFSNVFFFVPTFNCDWKTGVYGPEQDEAFAEALTSVVLVVRNLLRKAKLEKEAQEQTQKALENMKDHVVVIGRYCPHMTQVVENNAGEPNALVTVFSNSQGQWNVQVVPKEIGNFDAWVNIPEKVSELPGFVFRHKGAFVAGFTNEYDAIKAAKLTVKGFKP